jgi:TolB-like protein
MMRNGRHPADRTLSVHLSTGRCLPVLLLLLLTAQVFPADSRAQNQPAGQQPVTRVTIGVLELDVNNVDAGEARAISERLRAYLGRTNVFQVIERNKMETIMQELGFQLSGACDTDECVVQVGKILGASKMVAGSVSRVGTLYSLQVRIVDITTSQIETQAFRDVNGIEQVLTEATQTVANELADFVRGGAAPAAAVQPRGGQPTVLTTANVRFESTPPGATILVDDRTAGTSPATVVLAEGAHRVVLRREGYRDETRNVQVVAGRDRTETFSLREIPRGSISVTTDPPGCTVLVDGTAIAARTPVSRFQVYEGTHQVEVRLEGYESQTREVTITGRENATIELSLRPSGSAQLTLRSTLAGATAVIVGHRSQRTKLQRAEETLVLPPGAYTVTVKAKGYATFSQKLTLANGASEIIPVTLTPKSRAVAGLLSVVPGMGQFYARRGFMGVLMLGGAAATAVMTFSEKGNYNTLLDEYNALQQEYRDATTSAEISRLRGLLEDKHGELISSHDQMTGSALIMTAIWALNILDAYFLMPRLRPIEGPNVTGELDLGVRERRLVMTFTVNFR